MSHNEENNACSSINVDVSKSFMAVHERPNPALKCKIREDVIFLESTLQISNATSDMKKEASVRQYSNLGVPLNSRTSVHNSTKTFAVDMDDDVTLLFDDATQVEPTLDIRKESSTPLWPSNPGGICFSRGLLVPDGTSRYLGKWQGQNKESREGVEASSSSDLIAIGADGRGGRIQVLRSLNQSSLLVFIEFISFA